MPRLRLLPTGLSLATAAALTTGCGGSVDVAAVKTQLGGVADALDRCVAKTNDARKCTTGSALGSVPEGTELGTGEGEIEVQADRPLRYGLIAQVGDGVQFSIVAAPVGARKRYCLPAGRSPCPANGAW